ncbi:unnamed protein product [Bathycoccus prasinos]
MTSVATSTASSERDTLIRCDIGYPQHAVRLFVDNRTTITGMLNCIVDSQRRHERVSKGHGCDIFAQVFEEYKNFKGKDIDYTGKVLKLKKKLYGAKSSGLGWYEHLRELLQQEGFILWNQRCSSAILPMKTAIFLF